MKGLLMDEEKRIDVVCLKTGYFETIERWYEENNIPDVVLRLWTKEQLEPDSEFPECEFVYITQIIRISDDDFLIGYQYRDERYKSDRYPYVDWKKFSEIELAYSETDQ